LPIGLDVLNGPEDIPVEAIAPRKEVTDVISGR
jgi:hypothetical protein